MSVAFVTGCFGRENKSIEKKFKKQIENSKSYYLKHILDKDNKVTESYACAILKGKEYCVRGGKDNNGNSFYGYASDWMNYLDFATKSNFKFYSHEQVKNFYFEYNCY
jgi:hypothetical protein